MLAINVTCAGQFFDILFEKINNPLEKIITEYPLTTVNSDEFYSRSNKLSSQLSLPLINPKAKYFMIYIKLFPMGQVAHADSSRIYSGLYSRGKLYKSGRRKMKRWGGGTT